MQTEEQEQLSIEEKSKLFVELLEKRKKHFASLRAQEKRNKPPTKAQKRNTLSTYLKNMSGYKHNQLKSKSYDEIQEMFDKEMKRVNTFVDIDTELVKGSKTKAEESFKRAGEELKSDNSKKQRIDEHIVQDDEVAIDAIPLAIKPPVIVEWKIIKEGKLGYFQLIRADGSSKRYSSMIQMLQNIDKEDLEALWKLVKAKHENTRPEEAYERVLWGYLKVIFEHDIESEVWRSLERHNVTVWKLFSSSGVHFVRFKDLHIFMLVEKKYPLTPATITGMLNKKLQVDQWNEMSYQLLKLLIKKINIKFRGGLLGLKDCLELILLRYFGFMVYLWFYPTIPEVIEVAKASNAYNFISQMTTGIPGTRICKIRVVNEIDTSAARKNKEWQDKLPNVLKAEEIIYSKASSKTFDEVKVDVGGDMFGCTQGVSENADTSRKVGEDVNAIVRKVTEVLRGGDGLMSVEERLDEMMWSLIAMWIKNGEFVTTSMIYILEEAKRYEFVEGLCEEMERLKDRKIRKAGFEPDVTVYKVMLRMLCNCGKAYIAMEFYKEMVIREALEVLRNMKNKDIVIEPDHFQTLLNGMCHADRMADALEIVDILKRKDAVDKNIYGMHVFTILGLIMEKLMDGVLSQLTSTRNAKGINSQVTNVSSSLPTRTKNMENGKRQRTPTHDIIEDIAETIVSTMLRRMSETQPAENDSSAITTTVGPRPATAKRDLEIKVKGGMFGGEDKDQGISTESNVKTYVSEDVETPNELHVDNDEVVVFDEMIVKKGCERWKLTVSGYFVGYKMAPNELRFGNEGLNSVNIEEEEAKMKKKEEKNSKNNVASNDFEVQGRRRNNGSMQYRNADNGKQKDGRP
ncbi:ribonuclease H-like domain, reverse transcriptase, RNA-dependent DNA polymerase [Tanacetum coccineum]|uniref:Ribonuclease H-like domain, reverse transcriptase, RNA-dependent DNA polymerase n=1 Tax=Tanacetum coccineum TaxID=301880 RepID=A0ABQ5CF77_9ASTR